MNQSGSAVRTWVFKTNEDGYLRYSPTYLKSGSDDLYVDSRGVHSIPIGSITIQETTAPTGYALDNTIYKVYFIEGSDGEVHAYKDAAGRERYGTFNTTNELEDLSVVSEEEPILSGVKFSKIDRGLGTGSPEGDATLANAEITIYNNSGKAIKVGNRTIANGGAVLTIKTDASGNATTDEDALPVGTYYAKETKAPTGYLLNSSWRVDFDITDTNPGNERILDMTGTKLSDDVIKGDVKIEKWDKELNRKASQGDADFSGIRFEITNKSSGPVVVGGVTYAVNAKIENTVLTTNAVGDASTTGKRLPYGTYEVKEAESNGKYLLTDGTARTFTVRSDGEVVNATSGNEFKDIVVKGGVKLHKIDSETGSSPGQGQATLKGAEITIYNNSAKAVTVNGTEYAKGAAVMTIKTDDNGIAETAKDALPYGTYYAKETKSSEGYLINSNWRVDFQIREDRVIVDKATTDKLPEEIVRADVSWSKLDIDGTKMANIPFLISRLDEDGNVVESHVIVTDADGKLNTKDRPKTGSKVNSLDSYVDGSKYTGPLDGTTGVWFGEQSARAAGKGSLIYARYVVEELQSEATSGMDMLKQQVIDLNADLKEEFTNGKVFELKNVFINLIIHPESDLLDDTSETKVVSLREDAKLIDSFRWDHLKIGHEYKLKTEIYYEDREGNITLLGENTQALVPQKVDSTNTSYGVEKVTVTVNTKGLNGGKLHAVDYIYSIVDGEEVLLSVHNEDMKDERQSLGVPYLHTVARDGYTLDHIGTVTEEGKLIDKVEYENLPDRGQYIAVGTLRFADTGEEIQKVERMISISKRVTEVSEKSDGSLVAPVTGSFEMPEFSFDASTLDGRTLVVTEELYDYITDELFIDHYDLTDEDQSVHFPEVTTKARDGKTEAHTGTVGLTETVIDEVTITNAVPGMTYTVGGTFVYVEDCVDSNGDAHKKGEVIATHEPVKVVAESDTVVVELTFEVDSSALAGLSAVVFEDLYHNDILVAVHHDYDSEDQTINYPDVRTTAKDGETGTHTGVVGDKVTIVDTVELKNLTEGDSYKVIGTLMNQDGSKVDIDPVESEVFTATEKDMTVELTFELDSTELGGKSLVVFEKLIFIGEKETVDEDGNPVTEPNEVEVARHEDPDDEGQTVHYPEVRTNAYDSKTNDGVGTVGEKEIIYDKVLYTNLVKGEEYTVTGDLHYAENCVDAYGKPHKAGDVVMEDGKAVTAETTFTAEDSDGYVILKYEVNSDLLKGVSVVVFEDLVQNGVKVTSHADITDEDQRIDYPEVKTTLISRKTGDQVGDTSRKTVMIDTVELKNLIEGETYTIRGTLMDKDTNKEIEGVETEPVTFVATERDMTMEISFTLNGKLRENMTTVAFEELIHKGVVVNAHADLNDKDQTVWTPKVETKVKDAETGVNVGRPRVDTTIVDEITVTNLIVGREYTITGYLMDQKTGEKYIGADGNEVKGEPITFVAERATEVKEMTFTFNGANLKGKTVVAFEDLSHNDVIVAAHHDLKSEPQSVDYPDGRTSAKDAKTGTKTVNAEEKAVVIDTLTYENLRTEYKYLIIGELVDKETGEVITTTFLKDFQPKTKNGSVELRFEFNAELLNGKALVAFETIKYGDKDILIHADLNDLEQTVYVEKPEPPELPPKTGDQSRAEAYSLLLLSSEALILALLSMRKRRRL